MIPFHSRCPDEAARETFGFIIEPGGALPPGEFAIVEWYCEDPECDCRRAFLQVVRRGQTGPILASINYGWESLAFYADQMSFDPDAPREITEGSLDPLNTQSPLAPAVLKIFQRLVSEGEIAGFLKHRYEMFRAAV
jgi:hypothetical protein